MLKAIKYGGLLIFFFAFAGHAQNVPNAGFEYWHTVGGWFDDPDDWQTNNTSILAASVVKDSGAYLGVLAMRVQNVTGIRGMAYTGFPLAQHPASIHVYARSLVAGSDTNKILIRLYDAGNLVDSGIWINTLSVSNWTLTAIPVSQNSQNMDSLLIEIKSGHQTGSWISVDEFSIDFSTGFPSLEGDADWTLVPNPVTDCSILTFKNTGGQACSLSVYNTAGQHVRELPATKSAELKIVKGALPQGVYYFILLAGGVMKLHGGFCVD